MARPCLLLAFCFIIGSLHAQQSAKLPVKKERTTDENGQHISFEIPQNWKFSGGIISDSRGQKVGEFMPGTIADCPYKSGSDYLKELKAGYADDIGSPQFVGSRTLIINTTAWTEGVRNVPLWNGHGDAGRWYAHYFFAFLDKKCFEIAFYSKQRQLPNEENLKAILASIKLI
jgi:hypothetical protein